MADNTVQVLGDLPVNRFAAALHTTGTRLGSFGALMEGSRGELVVALQRKIAPYAVNPKAFIVDGIFGPITRDTLKRFQAGNGERATGIADDAFLARWGITGRSGPFTTSTKPTAPVIVDNGMFDPAVVQQPAFVQAGINPRTLMIFGGVALGAIAAWLYWTRK